MMYQHPPARLWRGEGSGFRVPGHAKGVAVGILSPLRAANGQRPSPHAAPTGAWGGADDPWPPAFDELLHAEKQSRRRPVDRAVGAGYRNLRARYEAAHGQIVDLYVCKHLDGAGTALTVRNEIKVRYPAESVASLQPEFEETLWRATALAREGSQVLPPRRAAILVSMVQSVVVCLLGVLDSQHRALHAAGGGAPGSGATPLRIERSLATARRELKRIDRYLRQSAQIVAQKCYLQGMIVAVPLLAMLAAVRFVYAPSVPVARLELAGLAGGVGAVISVMSRISSGKLVLDCHADPILLRLAGGFRPIIGAVLGLAVYVLIQAGLVPVTLPSAPQDLYFAAAIAFLAGFSERWAQDMLVKTTAVALPAGGGADAADGARPSHVSGRTDQRGQRR
ncbi:MAG: hypothetical protein LC713_00455 [Actinobacteria bacterium]|nr:hypothetical protein [Actinomycetota bacterium]